MQDYGGSIEILVTVSLLHYILFSTFRIIRGLVSNLFALQVLGSCILQPFPAGPISRGKSIMQLLCLTRLGFMFLGVSGLHSQASPFRFLLQTAIFHLSAILFPPPLHLFKIQFSNIHRTFHIFCMAKMCPQRVYSMNYDAGSFSPLASCVNKGAFRLRLWEEWKHSWA